MPPQWFIWPCSIMGHKGKHFHAVFVPKLLNLQGFGSQLESKIGRPVFSKPNSSLLQHWGWTSSPLQVALLVDQAEFCTYSFMANASCEWSSERYLGAEVLELIEACERASQISSAGPLLGVVKNWSQNWLEMRPWWLKELRGHDVMRLVLTISHGIV